jgi:hypothetical protein
MGVRVTGEAVVMKEQVSTQNSEALNLELGGLRLFYQAG